MTNRECHSSVTKPREDPDNGDRTLTKTIGYFFKSAFGDNVIKIKDHLSVLIFVNTLKCTC